MEGDIVSLYRAILAKEKGTIKKDWGGKLSIALAYPSFYRLGMSNLGFQVVYQIFNKRSDIVAERVFLPEDGEMSLYVQSGKTLLSLESQRPLQDFDVLAFSLCFENDYLNILKILDLAKMPLLSEHRADNYPLVVAGGVTTFLNPEPIAPFIDFFLIGEAEANLEDFLDLLIEAGSGSRSEMIRYLAVNAKGLYAPSLYKPEYHENGLLSSFEPQAPGVPEKIDSALWTPSRKVVTQSLITTPETEFGDKVLMELNRGCGRACRFCAAGYVYRPPREYHMEDLQESIGKALGTGHSLGLVGTALSDVHGIEELTNRIIRNKGRFSISSLRADALTKGLVESLQQAGQKTVSIAPEAGSERLRKVANKHLAEEQILDAVTLIASVGDFSIRLYFLIGLPTEKREDIHGIVSLVKSIKHRMVKESAPRGRMGHIRLSVNCFVPKPFTPFQWFPLETVSSLKEKQKWLKKGLVKEGGIKVTSDLPKWAYIQTLLSIGDRRVASILMKAHESGGDWTKALRFSEVNPDFFVYRPKALDEMLPWDFIDHGIRKEHLIKEYRLALEAKESDICRVGECNRCGACGSTRC
ncbi:MAG: radical SAM protein [Thermodesulfobacteriota bacterium]|nr:radical SAM protein [Thermodesulfobacteriota bacterium]